MLGQSAVAGNRVWDYQSCVRIEMGPLELADYQRFQPGTEDYQKLVELVRFTSVPNWTSRLRRSSSAKLYPWPARVAKAMYRWAGLAGSNAPVSTWSLPVAPFSIFLLMGSPVNLKSLFAKLNETSRTATESAAALCLSENHYDVEVEHLLLQLLDNNDNDLPVILRHYDVVPDRLQAQLVTALGTFKKGNTRTPALSPHITRMIEQAWVLASIEFGQSQIRTGHLVQALLDDDALRRVVIGSAPELEKINADDLRLNMSALVEGSPETKLSKPLANADASTGATTKGNGKTPATDQYTVNLTQSARDGRIDPVLGREFEVRQMVDILTRRRQNNPILTGEAGVGKTAVVEGGAAHCAGRRAVGAQGRCHSHAGSGPVAGRCRGQGRVRKPPQVGHRRNQTQPAPDHSVYR